MEDQNNQTCCCKSCSPWKSIAIILIILALAGVAYYFGTLKGKSKTDNSAVKQTEITTPANADTSAGTSTTSSSVTTGATSSTDKYPGWNTLTDTKVGYKLRYPKTWTAKIEDGVTDQNSVQGSGISYHYLSLGPLDQSGQKWGMNIGIAKKGSNVRMSMRTGVAPIGYPLTKGEIIKIAGSDVQIYESVYNGKITELFSYSLEGGSTPPIINKDYFLDMFLSYIGEYKRGSLGEPLPDANNTTTRRSEPYLTAKKILESIEFKNVTSLLNTYNSKKYGFSFSYPEGYKVFDDKDTLYGYPNGVSVVISTAPGTQSADVTVEIWDTEDQYKKKYTGWAKKEYVDSILSDIIVKKLNGKFVTFYGGNKTGLEKSIASTFKAN